MAADSELFLVPVNVIAEQLVLIEVVLCALLILRGGEHLLEELHSDATASFLNRLFLVLPLIDDEHLLRCLLDVMRADQVAIVSAPLQLVGLKLVLHDVLLQELLVPVRLL